MTDWPLRENPSVFEESREIDVASVEELIMLSDPPPSIEFKVEAILCFEGERFKKLEGRAGAVRPGLRLVDLVDEFELVHKRPRNLDATEPTSVGVTLSAFWASL